ncbi:fibronectin type III domain-containing protein, partial [bacterium]|nr:fibronectin type III domain-containing protein [bacterium]
PNTAVKMAKIYPLIKADIGCNVEPPAPSNSNAVPTGYNQIDLSWQDNAYNEDGFRIEKTTDPPNFSEIGTVGMDVTRYEDKTCSMGTTYYYRVRAYNEYGNSSYSNTSSATIPTGPPEAPSHLRAIARFRTVTLKWHDNSSNEQVFKIERKSYPYIIWEEIDSVEPNITTYKDTGLPCDQTFYYRVRAYNEYGHSSYSNIAETETFCFYCRIWF